MQTFWLDRREDESGVSGTGHVAQGVVFDTGQVALAWLTDVRSVAIYPDLPSVERIHGHGGKTQLVFIEQGAPVVNIHMHGGEIDADQAVELIRQQLERGLGVDLHPEAVPDAPTSPFLGGE